MSWCTSSKLQQNCYLERKMPSKQCFRVLSVLELLYYGKKINLKTCCILEISHCWQRRTESSNFSASLTWGWTEKHPTPEAVSLWEWNMLLFNPHKQEENIWVVLWMFSYHTEDKITLGQCLSTWKQEGRNNYEFEYTATGYPGLKKIKGMWVEQLPSLKIFMMRNGQFYFQHHSFGNAKVISRSKSLKLLGKCNTLPQKDPINTTQTLSAQCSKWKQL